ncbi:cytochrome c biogenesis protein CcsA [Lacibacter sp. H407]|uniref:cytochrome c biogenesis protein CcsA n=1 Tax=Lacibacter sp. H407 TaxID=3133423 RepID=UPI0030C0E356
MPFIGEQLLPGQIGNFLAVLSFVASLLATIAYFKATQSHIPTVQQNWKRIARVSFLAEIISVIGIFVALYFIISNHRFEYKYAWQHSNYQLPMQYILACFWEGQEGSFLLWSFWHCVLGGIIILREKKWEAPVMTTISFMQFALATMVIGIYFFDFKIGSNPFVLMRDQGMLSPEQFPIGFDSEGHLRSDYLSFIRDGNGLNPLLQNYWMTIHPPVLFLGFASTLVPFAFAIAGLWKKDYGGWVLPARPWALFSAGILGLGIMMGAAWAYESLTFGGYWAWDPVENASLVPWLISICGIHTLIAYKHTGHSLRATFLFFILQFLFIIYSTFLTRSGILGDTSVHAFTDLGMNAQLLTFLLIFVVPSLLLFGLRYKQIPTIVKEEAISAREFWLFVGSLLFFISAVFIIGKTSLPVINKIFGTKYAPAQDIEYSYNKVLILFSFVIAMLTAIGQYLKYKQTSRAAFIKSIWLPTLIALIASLSISIFGDINYTKYGVGFLAAIHLSIFAAVYSIIANGMYIVTGIKGKMIKAGASIAHVGFGLTLLGILVSASKKEVLSWNTSGIMVNFGEQSQENPAENLTLVKGIATDMGRYMVTYQGDSTHPSDPKQYFKIHFQYKNKEEGFTLYPDAFVNFKGNEGIMANPDSKHYIHKDVFTYITSLPNPDKNKDTSTFKDNKIKPGDTVFYSQGFLVLDEVGRDIKRKNVSYQSTDSVFAAKITVYAKDSSKYTAEPLLVLSGNNIRPVADTVISQSLILAFTGADKDGINLGVKESNSVLEYVTLKAYQFPAINVLWLGILVMTIGFLLATWNHIQKNRKSELKKV